MGKNNTVQPTVGTEQHLRGEIGQYIDAELIFSHQLQTSFFPSPPTRTIPPHPPWAGRKGREANRRAWWEDPRQVRGEYVLITEISLHGRFAKYKSLQSYLLWPILHTAEWSLKFKSNPLTPLLKTFQGLNEIQLLSMASNVPMAPAPLPSLLIVCFSSCFSADSSIHTYFPFIKPANFFPSSGHSAPVGPHSLESYCPATPGFTPSQPSCLYLNIPPQRLTSKNVQISFSHL